MLDCRDNKWYNNIVVKEEQCVMDIQHKILKYADVLTEKVNVTFDKVIEMTRPNLLPEDDERNLPLNVKATVEFVKNTSYNMGYADGIKFAIGKLADILEEKESE